MVKVRIQILSGEHPGKKFGPLEVTKMIWKNERGLIGFYKGIDSAYFRQAVYTTARFGIFLNLSDYLKRKNGGANLAFTQKMFCSLAAGGLGSLVGTPADLILIRMQSDSTLPKEQRRNYTSVIDACRRIPKEEGILGLWKGGGPTVIRAMSLNLGMFTSYEECKERFGAAMPNHQGLSWFLASCVAGSIAATMSLPFDNAKTKMQKMQPGPDGKMPYKHIFDAMGKTIAQDGVAGLWVGLPTYCVRIAPHVMITFIISEKLKKLLL
mmetsp:Transcript_33210/g.50909  ORF Transcript_33210/g.50909 Transcript_33210/m.50909 type:complete len:267 (-) Transcript_33210:30-830(-)